ncbi:NAD-dependent epimerase/dehydratase [Nitrobacter winogradskyi Nb-255]|uniref:NAD-dependent epimerase/dehydratase n=1 Tax=Nitrobacter winogradskyi (strain ATCC 25391 / DSM 10237 / CIP 104748 / NCIMB 11846 / Nb-255) TaxID=323098 RepID=Q3STQ5_NITWN|nr:NAD-dependent epimerase [Nitrobacter winogradskyi]ABA04336.1 NAD-dependent epimerase/dehydratase [Nitrobacter winogradskyi Nb-255]
MPDHPILVTGAAGFIGFHVAARLLKQGHRVVGIDSLNDYYDPALKECRLEILRGDSRFRFVKSDLADREATAALFAEHHLSVVLHLAAQAGVRYSLRNPHAYVDSNLTAFANVLEGCRHASCPHLLFASSSSVYGANTKLPFSVHDNVDHPISLYAATKKSNELMAHAYSHLYRVPTTGLRFFTVYGPWYRPDMALYKFADAIVGGQPIKLFNHGNMQRDFTFVDDVVEAVVRLIDRAPQPHASWSGDASDAGTSSAPWRIYNIGNNKPAELMGVVALLEKALGRSAQKELLPMQPGDVQATFADIDDLARDVGFRPSTSLEDGIHRFADWYCRYHRVS